MAKLTLMVGLPASGKTRYTSLHYGNNAIVLNKDVVKAELAALSEKEISDSQAYNEMYARAKHYLVGDYDVVIDGNHINYKTRHTVLERFKRLKIEREAVVLVSMCSECVKRDSERTNPIGEEAIWDCMRRFEIPMRYEGFDKVSFIVNSNQISMDSLIAKAAKFDLKSPYHKHRLQRHNEECYKLVKKETNCASLIEAAYLHDIGKLFTQVIDDAGNVHYYNHANVGAYFALCSDWLDRAGFIETVFYINYHTRLMNLTEDKSKSHYRKLFGTRFYANLEKLGECDRKSSEETAGNKK